MPAIYDVLLILLKILDIGLKIIVIIYVRDGNAEDIKKMHVMVIYFIQLKINADHLPSHLQTQHHSGTPSRIKCCTRPKKGWLEDHEPKAL